MLGRAPAKISKWVAGANLFALKKKDDSVRPVAAGDVTRRLVSKLCCLHCKEQASELLQPFQYGVGIKGGAEAVVHCSRALLAQNPELASLQLDFRNAFNEVERAPILEEVGQHFPSILAWVSFCYGSPTKLHFRSKFLESSRGVQQGDPLGPLLFCLSIQGIIHELKNFPSILQFWYMDDSLLLAPLQIWP